MSFLSSLFVFLFGDPTLNSLIPVEEMEELKMVAAHSLTHQLTYLLTHSLAYLLSHSPTPSLTHSHSLTYLLSPIF